MKCGYDSHCKESYLVNTKRESIIFDNFDFEFGLGINKVLVINVREVKDEVIDIEKISFEDDSFILEGSSYNRFDNVIIENVITFEKIEYPVTFNNHNFSFAIPYSDIVSSQIKKWELKSGYVMRVPNRITFFKQYHEIFFANTRNKILISDDVYDSLERLFKINNELIEANKDIRELNRENSKLARKNTRLTKANSKLSNQNERLNETIEEFKSRKVVKAADKVKRIL